MGLLGSGGKCRLCWARPAGSLAQADGESQCAHGVTLSHEATRRCHPGKSGPPPRRTPNGAPVQRCGSGAVPGMRSAALTPVRWWAGPVLLAAVALALDAADRRIPFGVWTTGPVDEVVHLSTATLALLVLARFIAAPRRFDAAALIASVAIDVDHIPLDLGLLETRASVQCYAFAVHRGRVRRRRGGQSQAPCRGGRGGDWAGTRFRAGHRRGLPGGAGLLAASGHFLDGQLPVVPGNGRRVRGRPRLASVGLPATRTPVFRTPSPSGSPTGLPQSRQWVEELLAACRSGRDRHAYASALSTAG